MLLLLLLLYSFRCLLLVAKSETVAEVRRILGVGEERSSVVVAGGATSSRDHSESGPHGGGGGAGAGDCRCGDDDDNDDDDDDECEVSGG